MGELKKEINIGASLISIQAMLEVSLKLQAQIIANQEDKDFDAMQQEVSERVNQNIADIYKALKG